MLISGLDNVEIASSASTLLVFICYCFCGLLVPPSAMLHFWRWVYRANPFTYLATGFISTSLARAPMHCADHEYKTFRAPQNQSCAQYMCGYINDNGGALVNPGAIGNGEDSVHGFGVLWVYAAFNIFMAVFLYWLLRVLKKNKR
ncbi:CDR ABC transporter [Penicillium samsonianum]|uniref:CDR ABC transporter n=1 Tax=Penicillium samsonianum TaxID=1882272 RepID=UPI002547CC30|nr:CDR ABC transporter [Penicillium samsonianum]KAJ6149156.1 CDR ABC transporter [Penicillium samsonianum]